MPGIFEFRIMCPNCKTETGVVAEETSPIIFQCHGCDKNIVIDRNTVYTITKPFLNKLLKRSKSRLCGQIIGYKPSKVTVRREAISEKQIKDLHHTLENTTNVDDFIKNL